MSQEGNHSSGGITSVFGKITDTLRDAIFEDEKPASSTAPAGAKEQKSESSPVQQASKSDLSGNPMVERLHQAVMTRNTGFRQLVNNMSALESVIADEPSRLRAALAVLQQNGTTAKNLLQDVDLHLRDLQTQEMRFHEEDETARKERVGQRESDIADRHAAIDKAQAQIASLQQSIADEQAKIEELTTEIKNQTQSLDVARQQFSQAMEHEKSWLERNKEALTALLSEAR